MTDSAPPPEPLRQYAFLGDGERGALIGPRGEVGFLCAPQWHDDAVFCDLLGGRSRYSVTPRDDRFVWGGYYEQDTLVWRSRWVTSSEIVECREALAFPGDPHRLVLLRQVCAVDGDAPLTVVLDARAGFDAHPVELQRTGKGTWEGRSGSLHLRWSGVPDDAVRRNGPTLGFDLDVPAGGRHDLVLEISDRPLPGLPDPDRMWAETSRAWEEAMPDLAASLSPGESRHSYAVLRGLTTATGATVAAATTALPERAEQHRDYDYRYAWIRDQCYVGLAAAASAGTPLLDAAAGFISDRLLADGSRLRPAYTLDGDPLPKTRPLELPGYPGAADVSTGNKAGAQFQLDAFGEALQLLSAADEQGRLDERGWRAIETAVRAIEERRHEADAGIWELDDRRWTHSRLACVAGLRSAAARRGGETAAGWVALAEAMLEDCRRHARHPDGYWQRSPDDPAVDAALLVPALRGAVPADDPLTVGTVRAVIDQLTEDGHVYRFRHDDRPLHMAEGAFVLSGFHLAMAVDQQGRRAEALRWFERGRGALGPPGLFAEEYDVVQRQLRGNLPQAFVHAGLLESAARLAGGPGTGAGFERHERGDVG